MRLHNFRKRFFPLFVASVVLFMTFVDCGIYRPMKAQAAATAATGGIALLVDVLMGLGVTVAAIDTVNHVVESVKGYTGEKKQELSSSGKSTIHYSASGTAHGGAGKSFELKASDLEITESLLNGGMTISPGELVPPGFMNVLRAWAVQVMNVSALDGTAYSQTLVLPTEQFLRSFRPLPISFEELDGLIKYRSTDLIWAMPYKRINSSGVYVKYIYKTGTVITKSRYDEKTDTWNDFSGTFPNDNATTNSGYNVWNTYGGSCFYPTGFGYITDVMGVNEVFPPSSATYTNAVQIVKIPAIAPTVDVPIAEAPATVWNGVADVSQTISNQARVKTESDKQSYVEDVFSSTANPSYVADYNTLNYILFRLANYLGVETVAVSVNDVFINTFYQEYVNGSSAEKFEQANEIVETFAVVNGSGPDNDDKNFKVINILVNAYILALIAQGLLPENTPEVAPGTQYGNVEVVENLNPKPQPSEAPNPTDAPDPSESPEPNPDPNPGIDLKGILDWLSKIWTAITSIPGRIMALPSQIASAFERLFDDIATKLQAIPDAFANSRLGQWVKTIPDILTSIKNAVLEFPQILSDIFQAIMDAPGVLVRGFVDFFTLDMAQINASYAAMTEAFKGKFSALEQIGNIFSATGSFDETIPVITMGVPESLQSAFQGSEVVIMDLRPYAGIISWCRAITTAILWVAFGKYILDEFDVKFHVG